jgi:alpha 1,2-mannosyltransferase
MLINTPPCISTVVRISALVVFLLTCGSYFLPRKYEVLPIFDIPILRAANITETSSTFNASVVEFWQDLASALIAATPQCSPLKVLNEHMHPADTHFDPLDTDRKAPDRLVDFTDQDETALLRAHYAMRTEAQRLAPRLPFAEGTTGIVTTANRKYMPVLLVSLRMLRRTGCKLPVQVFIDDWDTYDTSTCDILLPSLNARCVIISEIYSQNNNTEFKNPEHFQYKVLAILFSTFEHVLFLDSDAFPAYDPSVLFTTAPYTSHGLVTWPDYFALTVSPHYYHIASIPPEPVSTRFSTESGQLLLRKSLHRESLLMMLYYNYFGPDYYYPLLCQGSHGAGDKETAVLPSPHRARRAGEVVERHV